jgi:hypothetical protein
MPTAASTRPGRIELLLVTLASFAASCIAIVWSWTHHAFLLYGDAEAHIHIARRIIDSHRPGLTQLGSVWLPLPHLLLIPFLAIDPWWRSGFAPVIPSAACYLLASLGLYRLMRRWLGPAASSLALILFAANPNLLYLQTTAMTEPLFLCELIWTVLLLLEWYESLDSANESQTRFLWTVIAVLVAAVYTRYDGWILACLAWVAMAICLYRRGRLVQKQFISASIVLLLAPVGWMIYNAAVFGDWLDFMRGPYSAAAIELRTATSATDPHPGWHNPWLAFRYFLRAAEMDAVEAQWGWLIVLLAIVGTVLALLIRRRNPTDSRPNPGLGSRKSITWTLLLWLPLPFYAYSVSYGSVPIFLPVLPPFSWYNTRYGLELLPALSFFLAFALEGLLTRVRTPRYRVAAIAILFVLIASNPLVMLRQGPLTYVEAKKNTESRGYYNTVLAQALTRLHTADPGGIVLMDTSTFPSLVPHAGLTYRQTLNESDKEFYHAALAAPAAKADIVLAFTGDEIDKAIHAHPEHLRVYQRFHSPFKGWDQPDATIYITDTFPAAPAPLPSTPQQSQ